MSLILGNELTDRAMSYLQVGRLVIMATVDERGMPNTSPISWITAIDRRLLRLAVSPEVNTFINISKNPNVMISLLGGAMTLGIRGRARVLLDQIEDVPFPMAMVEIEVDEVKDDSVIGRGIAGELIKWEDRRRTVSDIRVETALRNGPPDLAGVQMQEQTLPQYNE
jgi:hypothetical protein